MITIESCACGDMHEDSQILLLWLRASVGQAFSGHSKVSEIYRWSSFFDYLIGEDITIGMFVTGMYEELGVCCAVLRCAVSRCYMPADI
jgi:hypothetical protein